ncbi:class I SAM-dependent methyltransferase [Neisseria zalophi]|uniref:Methyltransferase domain-containing protein n=1 Tax=Neisseria zalophi TaxID=640030 RepID=A0A5J6PYJ4_9NEIS|nr:methyltransferase domain-containing protein [Neisseria zalophi]QEY26213.1 methyltransferase domain-containing protein [Neisseria zalophi]
MRYELLKKWFLDNPIGLYTADWEKRFFKRHTSKQKTIGKIVQFGMEDWLKLSENDICVYRDILMQPDFLAFPDSSLSLLIMPHTLEISDSPYQTLVEAFRVLEPEGKLVISGFNPYSLWYYRFNGKKLPEKQHCQPLANLKKQIKSLNFEIEQGQFMVYVPPVKTEQALKRWQFMEAAGNRWWPSAAAVYGLVLQKRIVGVKPLPECEHTMENSDEMVAAMALSTNGSLKRQQNKDT